MISEGADRSSAVPLSVFSINLFPVDVKFLQTKDIALIYINDSLIANLFLAESTLQNIE